jgi:hypothetical protein
MIDKEYEDAISQVFRRNFVIDNDPDMMKRYDVLSSHLETISRLFEHRTLMVHLDSVYTKMLKRFFQKLPKDKWNVATHVAGLHFFNGGSVPYIVQTYKLGTRYRPQNYLTAEDAIEELSELLVKEVVERFKDKDMIYFYQPPYVIEDSGFMMYRIAGIKN